jgi:hypothetical protein
MLLESGSPLAVVLGEAADWHRVYFDSLSDVFVRRPRDQEPAMAPSSPVSVTPKH